MTSPKCMPESLGNSKGIGDSESCLIERRSPRHRDGNIGRAFERKLANFDANLPDAKFPKKVRCEIVSQGFEQLRRLPREELFHVLTECRIIDRARDRILQIAEITCRPKRNIQDKALRSGPLGFRNADPPKHFKLLNVNLLISANSHFFEILCFGDCLCNRELQIFVIFSELLLANLVMTK